MTHSHWDAPDHGPNPPSLHSIVVCCCVVRVVKYQSGHAKPVLFTRPQEIPSHSAGALAVEAHASSCVRDHIAQHRDIDTKASVVDSRIGRVDA